jgi:hypothetical protein
MSVALTQSRVKETRMNPTKNNTLLRKEKGLAVAPVCLTCTQGVGYTPPDLDGFVSMPPAIVKRSDVGVELIV